MAAHWKALLLLGLAATVARAGEDGDGEDPADGDDYEQDALSPEQIKGIHGKVDQNGDGKVSMHEIMFFADEMRKLIASKDISTVMEEMDANKDGRLSLEELLKDMDQWGDGDEEDKKEAADKKKIEAEKFKIVDADQDGMLDLKELPALFYPETHDGVLEVTAQAALKQKDTDGDGELTPKEFWEGDAADDEDMSISEDETADFGKLDLDGSGKLNLEELKAWESGRFHTEEAMKRLFEIVDKDHDMHLSESEMVETRELIAGSDAQYHLMEWVEHHEL